MIQDGIASHEGPWIDQKPRTPTGSKLSPPRARCSKPRDSPRISVRADAALSSGSLSSWRLVAFKDAGLSSRTRGLARPRMKPSERHPATTRGDCEILSSSSPLISNQNRDIDDFRPCRELGGRRAWKRVLAEGVTLPGLFEMDDHVRKHTDRPCGSSGGRLQLQMMP
jgi:hypothetical protein